MKEEKVMPIMLGVVLILLILEFSYAIYHHFSYQKRVYEGNARWQEVDTILKGYEERIEELERGCWCGRDS